MAALAEFAHGGSHLENDDSQAHWTLGLLAVFAFVMSVVIVLALRGA